MTDISFAYRDDDAEFEGLDDFDEWFYEEDGEDDGESALESLARLATDVEAGRAELYPGWELDRSRPGVLVWTTPAGRRYASTLTGDPLPLP